MAFTAATIVHSYLNADGTPASGALTFWLSGRMTQSGTTIVPAEITANLSATGALSQSLTSNLDPATIPQNTTWNVTMRILGDSNQEFAIQVPSGGGTIDLGTLLPQGGFGG